MASSRPRDVSVLQHARHIFALIIITVLELELQELFSLKLKSKKGVISNFPPPPLLLVTKNMENTKNGAHRSLVSQILCLAVYLCSQLSTDSYTLTLLNDF